MVHYDALTVEARSLLRVFIDFLNLSREKIANAGGVIATKPASTQQTLPVEDAGSLFSDDAVKPDKQ
jgi:hypothetical protein